MWVQQPIRDWIDAVCRQYSRVMGCALTFDPHSERSAAKPHVQEIGGAEQWRASISDGTQTVGVLRLRSRAGRERDAGFLRACEAAELTAHLIEQVVASHAAEEISVREELGPHFAVQQAGPQVGLPDPRDEAHEPSQGTSIERLLDVIRRQTGFPAAALFVLDQETNRPRLAAVRASEALEFISGMIASCPETFGMDDANGCITVIRRSVDAVERSALLPHDIGTAVIQRLGGPTGSRGALWLFDRRDRRLTHRERHVLEIVSPRLAQFLERAMLLDDRSLNRIFKRELIAASRTQPSSHIEYTSPDGRCEIAGCMQSVRGVGGDLFELIPLANDRLFLAIGDAAGHSIPAALVMANVRGAIRALFDCSGREGGSPRGRPPHEVLQRVNSVLHGIVQSHQFMTMFCGTLDRRNLALRYANAGHPQPLLIRNGQVEPLESHGLVLGVTEEVSYDETEITLRKGDILTLYSDGVTEALCRDRRLFGSQGVEDAVSRHADQTAIEIRDQLWNALQTHLLGSGQRDDRTLAILRIAKI